MTTKTPELPFDPEAMDQELRKRGWDVDTETEQGPVYRRFQGSDNEQYIDELDFARMATHADQLIANDITTVADFAHQMEMHAVHRAATLRAANRIVLYVHEHGDRLNELRMDTIKCLTGDGPRPAYQDGTPDFMLTTMALSLQSAMQLGVGDDIWQMIADQMAGNIFEGWEPDMYEPDDDDFVPEMCKN
ncbi:MAG: hypothetical protein GWN58_32795 [Anaerolineae bacterium]|nr:hypothetical protein [Thermoplasmata archaeon]NIV34054.1 hypothetical protein [Anaerolineae bacterium]NIY05905.1 hypothetical protein [Thermoplasmata archaeon]